MLAKKVGSISRLTILAMVLAVPTTRADILLFDIDANPNAWHDAVSELVVSKQYDFDLDPDYGIVAFYGPLTSAGGAPPDPGPVSPGVLPDKTIMDSERDGPGGGGRGQGSTGLVALGPKAGFGNESNAILANFFVDAFKIDLSETTKAFEFNALTFLGSDFVDVIVADDMGGTTLFRGVHVGAGRNLGLIGTGVENIVSVIIFDPSGGAEGVQGIGRTYVPEPGSAALLGFWALGMMLIRCRKPRRFQTR